MVNLDNKEEFEEFLIEARKESYDNLYDKIELLKSVYGKKFSTKMWEYYKVNIDYSDTEYSVNVLDSKIHEKLSNSLNEKKI